MDGLPREKVIAAVVRMLDDTGLRVGNDEYEAQNDTFGITTIRKTHVDLHGSEIALDFLAKGSKEFKGSVEDALLAHVLEECGDLPGKRLFQFIDHDGKAHAIGSMDINHWLQQAAGAHITAKDFRTWTACKLFVEAAMTQTDTAYHLKPILKSRVRPFGQHARHPAKKLCPPQPDRPVPGWPFHGQTMDHRS